MNENDELVIVSFMISNSSTLYGYHGLTEPEILAHFGDSGQLWVSYTGPNPILRCNDRLAHLLWLRDHKHPAFSWSLRCLLHRVMIRMTNSYVAEQLLGMSMWSWRTRLPR